LALADNPSLKAAQSRLDQMRALTTVARSGLVPQVDAGAQAIDRRFPATTLGPEAFSFPIYSAYATTLTISYTPDIFGGVRRSVEQVSAEREVAVQGLAAARLSVAAEVVGQALSLASANAQKAVLADLLATDNRALEIIEVARERGVASEAELNAMRALLDYDRALQPQIERQWSAARDALAVLVGRTPAVWSSPEFNLDSFALPGELPLVVPSEIVRVRPDIRAAEAQLHASSAAIGVATADLYPRLDLAAAGAMSGLLSGPSNTAWRLFSGLTAPVFNGGVLNAKVRVARFQYQADEATYRNTVLRAFQQVADTLQALSADAEEVQAQQTALTTASAAASLSQSGFKGGEGGVVRMLDGLRLCELARLDLLKAQARRYADSIQLFTVTGGGVLHP
jgi:NodT family efflux transporter outer membrane factor (OMF) lipoprotein